MDIFLTFKIFPGDMTKITYLSTTPQERSEWMESTDWRGSDALPLQGAFEILEAWTDGITKFISVKRSIATKD